MTSANQHVGIRAFACVFLVFFACVRRVDSQTPPRLAIDATRPIVYVEFDHAGPREPVEEGEPNRGLWLRLVNNSVVPINVRANGTMTDPEMTILPDVITPRMVPITKNGLPRQKMPRGYWSSVATRITIGPGDSLMFSVPENHVAPSWYMEVPFEFDLPAVKRGVQPTCLAPFTWEDIPSEARPPELGEPPELPALVPDLKLPNFLVPDRRKEPHS